MEGLKLEERLMNGLKNERTNSEVAGSLMKVQYKEHIKKISKVKPFCRSDGLLYDAVKRGDLSEVTRLVNEGCNVHAKDSHGRTPLYFAIKYGHLNIVQYLVNEEMVEVSAKDSKGEIPLYYAVKYNNLDITKYLIEKFSIKNGYTPLHWAAKNGNLDTVKYIVDEKKIDVNIRDRNRYTPLHYAAQNGKLDIVKYLAGERKADPDVKDKYGRTPLDLAVQNNHFSTIKYLISESNLNETDKPHLGKNNNEIGGLMLLAKKKKGEIIDRVIGIVDIAFGVKDILSELGIIPDEQSKQFEKVLDAIGKNYAAIEEVGNKVDRNFAATKVVFEVVSKTLSTIEETRIEMRQGFKHVLESINELGIKDKISSLATFMDDFKRNVDIVEELSPNVRVVELERSGGILDKLRSSVASDGILHGNLYHIINERLAIPKYAEDNVAFVTLHVLYYGVQTYVSEMFFVLDQYSYLADHYYQKGDIEKCNEYFDLLQISFNDFKESLLNKGKNKRLINKVIDVLIEVQGLLFVRNKRQDVFQLLQKRIDSLNMVTQKIQEMTLPIVPDQPDVIMRKPDFSKSEVATPIGKWKKGTIVSYAVQYKDNNTYSKVGEWSDAFTVYEKANPFLKFDSQRRTRLIFRKFNNDKPELVGTVEAKTQILFRDISRDLYDAALSSNEDIGIKEAEILIKNGANINEIFDDGRRAIHAAARGGNSKIALDFFIKNNATDINVKDTNGYTPIYIAAEAGYEDFVKFSISNGADVNVKTNLYNFTPLHISAYKGDVSTVEVLMQSDDIDMNARDNMGYVPLHSAVSGGTYVVNTLLSSNNTDINAKSKEGLTPLHLASINDYEDIAEVLMKSNKIDINSVANGNLTALHFASSLGNTKVVRTLVAQNETDINVKSSDSWTALHLATFLKKEDTALELLKAYGVEVNAKGKNDITPLHVSTVTGQKNVTSSLLKNGALVEEKTQDSLTALHLAAMHNKYEIISILIDNKANIEAKTMNGSTPLNLAAALGNKKAVLTLLDKGADIKAHNNNGQSPIHEAVLNGKEEVVCLLVEHDPSLINLCNQNGEYPLHLAAEKNYANILNDLANKKADLNIKNNAGETPLHYAVKNDSLDAIEYLSERGADLNRKDNSGWAPLHWAAKDNHSDAIKCLAKKGAYLNIKDSSGWTPLHWAAKNNHADAIKCLAEAHADLNISDNSNLSPLHWAAKNNHPDAIKCLAEEGANLEIRDQSGWTPLHWAVKDGCLDAVKSLVKKMADINAKDNINSSTPLHFAAQSKRLDVVKYLVENGAKINAKNTSPWYGGTPLHYAASSGSLEIVKYLMSKGANVNAKDVSGTTPLHCSIVGRNLDVIKFLVENGAAINDGGMSGRTPLFDAAVQCNLNIVKYLAEKGADINRRDENGYTPLTFITGQILPREAWNPQQCYLDIVKFLKSHRSVGYFRDNVKRQNDDIGLTVHYSNNGDYSDVKYLKSSAAHNNINYDNTVIGDNPASSGASKPSSWISVITHKVVNAVEVISQFLYSPSKAELPVSSEKGTGYYSTAKNPNNQYITQFNSEVCFGNNVVLALFFLQSFLDKKYPFPQFSSVTPEEAIVSALNITEKFEEILRKTAKQSGVLVKDVNFFKVYLNIAGYIRNERYSQIPSALYSAAKEVSPGNKEFLNILKNKIKEVLDKQQKINKCYNDHMQSKNNPVSLSLPNSITDKPEICLNVITVEKQLQRSYQAISA